MTLMSKLMDRNYRHLTPRYVADRLRLMVHERRHPDDPWLTADAVRWLDRWLQSHHTGLEWGCGRSTIWFARRVAHLTSAESDAGWYAKVQQRLTELGVAERVSVLLTQDDAAYVGITDSVEAVDFALVDGITDLRGACALACLPKIRPSGIVVIDNVNWFVPREQPSRAPNSRGAKDGYASGEWAAFAEAVDGWPVVWTTNGVTDTAIWIKPGA